MRRTPEALRGLLADIDRQQRRRVQRVSGRSPRHGSAALSEVDGRLLVNFCSNDYLGLSQHSSVIAAFRDAASEHGVGSGAAHLLGGHASEHRELEQELAAFTGRERALLFSTGYMANLAVLCSFADRGEIVLQDRLNHASLIDGARLSGARLLRYAHGDAPAALDDMQRHPAASLLATDGVFSMDGDIAPLPALASACTAQGLWMLVDDAHGLGVVGPDGRGSVAEAGLDAQQVPLLMGTLGKAFGCFGAFVAGDQDVIEVLLQRARTYLFTTALPPAVAAAARAALQASQVEGWRREKLAANITRLRRNAMELGIALAPSTTAIQPLIVGDSATALKLGEALATAGFLVGVTRPPTVPVGSARLRITVSAVHEPVQIDALTDALAASLRTLPGVDTAAAAS